MTGTELLVMWLAMSAGNITYAVLFQRCKPKAIERAAGWSWAQGLAFLVVYWRMRTG